MGGIGREGLPLSGGEVLLSRDPGDRSSLGFRLRISTTLWELSACGSPGGGYGYAGVLGSSVLDLRVAVCRPLCIVSCVASGYAVVWIA